MAERMGLDCGRRRTCRADRRQSRARTRPARDVSNAHRAASLCASRTNGGVFHVGFRSVTTDPDELVRVIDEVTGNFVEASVARALADNALASIRWLQSFGTEFVPMEPTDGWKDYTLEPLGFHDKTAMAWQGSWRRPSDRPARAAGQRARRRQSSRRGSDRADHRERLVRGVTARTPQGPKSYRAKAVVFADGGFESNKDMLRRYVTPHPENIHMRAPDSGNGDGMRLAEAAGGMLIGMEAFYGHLLSADSLHREGLSPFPFWNFLPQPE